MESGELAQIAGHVPVMEISVPSWVFGHFFLKIGETAPEINSRETLIPVNTHFFL